MSRRALAYHRWFAYNREIGVYWEASGESRFEVRQKVRQLLYTPEECKKPWDEIEADGWTEVCAFCTVARFKIPTNKGKP